MATRSTAGKWGNTAGTCTVSRKGSGRRSSWAAATLADKLELEVGRDLQFIRINGTVIGGLVGLLLQLVYHLL